MSKLLSDLIRLLLFLHFSNEISALILLFSKCVKAREELQKLKGIVKLQAVIRGHLVRRQAVATYSCIWGIVKLQAVVRGKKARS